jgi:hypothetical protein
MDAVRKADEEEREKAAAVEAVKAALVREKKAVMDAVRKADEEEREKAAAVRAVQNAVARDKKSAAEARQAATFSQKIGRLKSSGSSDRARNSSNRTKEDDELAAAIAASLSLSSADEYDQSYHIVEAKQREEKRQDPYTARTQKSNVVTLRADALDERLENNGSRIFARNASRRTTGRSEFSSAEDAFDFFD